MGVRGSSTPIGTYPTVAASLTVDQDGLLAYLDEPAEHRGKMCARRILTMASHRNTVSGVQ
jgi:hypothetical protein